ncbi:MAG: type II secretion system inner membrane protein GspF [Pseudomonadota bacterium]
MAAYSYKALAADGRINKGIVEGESERQVRNLLRQRQLKPIEVILTRTTTENTVEGSPDRYFKLGMADLALFTRQLATLVQAGVPLDEAIAATAKQTPQPKLKSLLLQLRSKVVAGHSLAGSLAEFPQAFSELYQAMVRAGEHAGKLGEVLDQLADHIENRQQMQQKLQMALIYPLALLFVAVSVIIILMVFVMPKLVDLFVRTQTQLPLLTQGLIVVSDFVASYWWLLLLVIIAGVALVRRLLQLMTWRTRWHEVLLQLPVASRLLVTADTARFAATLSILVSSGVALVEAIGIAASVMSNLKLRMATRNVAISVQEGGSLARALDNTGFFPPMLTQMVASGESSGTLETMLKRAAQTQERELDNTLTGLMKIMEPMIIVVMAVVVGGIVMAVLLPIMQMNTLVG